MWMSSFSANVVFEMAHPGFMNPIVCEIQKYLTERVQSLLVNFLTDPVKIL